MTVIRIPPEVETTGSQFLSKSAELEALVRQAVSMMNTLQPQFQGQRANKIYAEWQQMQTPLQTAVQTLQTTGNFLKKAFTEFTAIDQGGI